MNNYLHNCSFIAKLAKQITQKIPVPKSIKLLKVKEILATRGIKVARQTLYKYAKMGLIPTVHKIGQCWYMNEDAAINHIIRFKKINNRGGDRKGWKWWSGLS